MTIKQHKSPLFFALPVLILLFTGCGVTNRIIEKEDIVHSSQRLELKLKYPRQDRLSPVSSMNQSFVREISANDTIYSVFDVLNLYSSSFKLKDEVYLIIDNKVYPMAIKSVERENAREISEDTEDIMTSDSTQVSVVTGYSENNRKITRFSYRLPREVVSQIKTADEVLFRYYTGPDMITIKLRDSKLKKLKQLIER